MAIDWKDSPSTETPLSAANLNDMEARIGAALRKLGTGHELDDTDPLALVAGTWNVIDGTIEQVLALPLEPVHGDLIGLHVQGSGGEIILDYNEWWPILGEETHTLVAPGAPTVVDSLWQFHESDQWIPLSYSTKPPPPPPLTVIEAAHTAVIGETIIVGGGGGYPVTIPEGEEHGDTITVIADYSAAFSVDIVYDDIAAQQELAIETPSGTSGLQVVFRYLKDLDVGSGPISGWHPTCTELIAPPFAASP